MHPHMMRTNYRLTVSCCIGVGVGVGGGSSGSRMHHNPPGCTPNAPWIHPWVHPWMHQLGCNPLNAPPGCTPLDAPPGCTPWMQPPGCTSLYASHCGQTDANENIPFPHTTYAVGNYLNIRCTMSPFDTFVLNVDTNW